MELLEKLESFDRNNCWEEFDNVFLLKEFPKEQNGKKNRKVLAKLGAILQNPNLPVQIKSTIIKSFTYSCSKETQYFHKPSKRSYTIISSQGLDPGYPESCFPFDEVTRWILDFLEPIKELQTEQINIVKDSLSFLCNFSASNDEFIDFYLKRTIKIIRNLLSLECDDQILTRICCLAHNTFNNSFEYFEESEENKEDLIKVIEGMIKSDEKGVKAARDSLLILIKKGAVASYEKLALNSRLYFLEFVCKLIKKELEEINENLPKDSVLFIVKKFKERSNLILKTEATYVKEEMEEPAEVIILLDILASLSCEMEIVKQDASLLISTVYLLKAIHEAGKSSTNNFTPLQKLTEIVPGKNSDAENHVAFGFKSLLIRLIANMVYKNRNNQDRVQELEGISLILDCCNIDARNPLIMQWCILAIRNLVEDNPENQQVILNSHKIRFIDTQVIQEMGISLNCDGTPIGIVPLPDLH